MGLMLLCYVFSYFLLSQECCDMSRVAEHSQSSLLEILFGSFRSRKNPKYLKQWNLIRRGFHQKFQRVIGLDSQIPQNWRKAQQSWNTEHTKYFSSTAGRGFLPLMLRMWLHCVILAFYSLFSTNFPSPPTSLGVFRNFAIFINFMSFHILYMCHFMAFMYFYGLYSEFHVQTWCHAELFIISITKIYIKHWQDVQTTNIFWLERDWKELNVVNMRNKFI